MSGNLGQTEPRPEPSGRRVLITGGGAGMGRVMALSFAAAGARVHIGDVDASAVQRAREEIKGLSGSVADVSDEGQVAGLLEDAVRSLGGLDILVNNAGIPGPTAAVEAVDPADWRRTIEVDITGMFLVTRAAVPHLKASRGGSIVNMSSTAGRLGFARRSPYAAAKWAVVGFTKSISIELGPFDINVNCVQPGPVAGALQDQVLAASAAARGITQDEARAERLRHVSMGRQVTQEEIAGVILFLCSPAGHAISGQAIAVDGDQTALA
ncbi:SDR family oxidoreductase [soil metagenome]